MIESGKTNDIYGIYIHIPFCVSKCKYCAFVSVSDLSSEHDYIDALIGEIVSSPLRGASADSVYIGGGTPSCLYRGALSEITAAVRDTFDISSDVEFTVECNPDSVDREFARECSSCGVTRVSMGLQSSDDRVLRAVGRAHSAAQYVKAAELLREFPFDMSSDLILGLPNQDKSDVVRSIDTIAEYCTHASVYALSVEAGTPLYKSGYSPNDDYVADMYDYAYGLLRSRGLKRYEVSNFAADGKQSRHNKKYWECKPYSGFGVAAHGYDGKSTRYAHADDLKSYIADPRPIYYALSDRDKYNEYVMLGLRTEKGIDCSDFSARFGYSFADKNSEVLSRLISDGYIVSDGKNIRIAPQYMFVMNGIIEQLMLDEVSGNA